MGIWDWLTSIFVQRYDAQTALQYVKRNFQKYGIIPAEDRPRFEKIFLKIANAEIERLGRNLAAEEVNIVVQRSRIRGATAPSARYRELPGDKILNEEWKTLRPALLEIYRDLGRDWQILKANLTASSSPTAQVRFLKSSREDILNRLQKLTAKAKAKTGFFPEVDELLKVEIARWTELVDQIDKCVDGRISYNEFTSFVNAFRGQFFERKKLFEKKKAAA